MNLRAELERLRHLAYFAVSRGRVTLVDDSGSIQKSQHDFGPIGPDGASQGVHDDTPMAYHFGFTCNPPLGADVITLFPGGRRTSGITVATNHQAYRLRGLGAGDSAVYDVRGAYLWFTAEGAVLDAAGLAVVVLNASSVTVTTSGPATVNCTDATTNASATAAVNCNSAVVKAMDDVAITCKTAELTAPGGVTVKTSQMTVENI